MNSTTSQGIIRFLVILMFVNTAIYFYSAYSETAESNDSSSQIQSMFFAISGITFAPLGIWMLKDRIYSRAPYVITIIISISLIGFYIASRSISLPVVGIQDDVGVIDIASKAIQGIVVVLSVLVFPYLKRERAALMDLKLFR